MLTRWFPIFPFFAHIAFESRCLYNAGRPIFRNAAMSIADDGADLTSQVSDILNDSSPPSPNLSPSRSSNVSSNNAQLLPPGIMQEQNSSLENVKTVTYWSGVCLVVSQIIGSGIFSTPALVNRNAGSVGMSLVLWIVAGCLAWTGACMSLLLDVVWW